MNKRELVLNIIGIFLLIMGISAIINTIYLGDYAGILWFCYLGLILLGISVLKRSSYMLVAQLNIFAIPLIFWTVDFLFILFNNQSLFGITDYFFITGPIIGKIISSQHLFTLPLSLYALHLIGLKEKGAWKLSSVEVVALFIISLIITPEVSNINCVYEPCVNFISDNFYTLKWFIFSFLMIMITTFFINLLFLKKKKAKLKR